MALIVDYGTLKTALSGWNHRGGLAAVEDQYDVFFQFVTSELNNKLRCRHLELTTTISSSTGTFALPADFLEMRSVSRGDGREIVSLVTPNQFDDGWNDLPSWSSEPRYFIQGTNLIYKAGQEDAGSEIDLQIRYYAKLADLVNDTDTNVILTTYPQLYLFGGMATYAEFAEEMQDVSSMWMQKFLGKIAEINQESEDAQFSGSPMSIRTF